MNTNTTETTQHVQLAPTGVVPLSQQTPWYKTFFESGGLVLVTIALALMWSFLPETARTFPSLPNLRVVLLSQSVLIVITMGVLIPLITKQYDFSVGATAGVSALFAAGSLNAGLSLPLAIAIALAVSLIIGFINGALVTFVKVDSVIVTLAMTTLLAGVATWYTSGKSIVSGIPDSLLSLSNPIVFGIPFSFAIALFVTVVTAFMLKNTPFGRYLHAIGSNSSAAHLVGLPTRKYTLYAFLLSALYSGAAGIILLGITGAGNPRVGPEFMLPAIAAAFLSVAAIKPGKFNVWGAFVAILFLAVLNSGLNLLGVDSYVNDFANGIALIAGVSLSSIISKKKR